MIYKNVSDAKAELSRLIEEALAGKEVVLGKAGKPLVRLTLYSPQQKSRKPGRLKGKLKVPDKFDELGDELALLFDLTAEVK